ncbi:MAG: hypothetical protein KAH86_10560 [Methanosarcinales archaeon]|nr:hypothetical protein [Methanosarcinales archaeon]
MNNNRLLLLVVFVIGFLAVSGCADNAVLIEQHNPSVEAFSVYTSGTGEVLDKGDEIVFTIEYKLDEGLSAEDYKSLPLDVDMIVLKPDALDVEFNHVVEDVEFNSESGDVIDSIAPNTKATLKVTVPADDAKWDDISSELSADGTVDFVLAMNINGLSHPLKSNVFKINV